MCVHRSIICLAHPNSDVIFKYNKEIKYMNNVKIVREVKKPTIYVGMEVMLAEAGTLVKVIREGVSYNDILMRTDSKSEPLLGLKNGVLWGTALETYTFEQVLDPIGIKRD